MKNIVFDFGQVLIHFEPSYMVGQYVTDPEDAKLLEEVVFDRLYWDRLDAGTITDAEMMAAVCKRLPKRLWEMANKVYFNWIYHLPEMEGMRELIKSIKEKYGVSVFLLSNISLYFSAHAAEFSIFKLFDKCIFSAECGMVKPNADIFEYLCAECGILPTETVFVDDNAKNIEGAQKLGITGYLFDGDAKKLGAFLDSVFDACN